MSLQRIKLTMSVVWVLAALVAFLVAGASLTGNLVIAALGVLPPVALLLLWQDPVPTMSERINQARR
jgi:hypothetical protein